MTCHQPHGLLETPEALETPDALCSGGVLGAPEAQPVPCEDGPSGEGPSPRSPEEDVHFKLV